MVTIFKELYRNGTLNAQILSTGYEIFGITTTDAERKRRWGSFNKCLIVNQSTQPLTIALDGLTDRTTLLPTTGSYEITPEEGLYFDFVKITNSGTSTITASQISIQYAIVTPIDAVQQLPTLPRRV
jgi:hypothetical protein